MSNSQPAYALLGKYFSGEASPEEAMVVDDWIRQHPDHRKLYDEAAAAWDNAAPIPHYLLPDKTLVLQEIERRAIMSPTKKNTWQIAAALLVLLGAATLYLVLRSSPAWQDSVPMVIRQSTDGISRDTLPDQSLAVLNSHSSIKYLQHEPRQLQLTGEAWFNVTFDPLKPFIVSVGELRIEVLGTTFNVRELTSVIEVALTNGAVRVSSKDTAIIVKAGQQLTWEVATRRFSLVDSFNPNKTGYATRIFNFENASLKEIVAQLEKAYGIKVILEEERLGDCTMSSAFDNKPIAYVLEVISITLNVQHRIENGRVYISGAGCN